MAQIWTETGFVSGDAWVVETDEIKAGSNEKALLTVDDFIAEVSAGSGAGFGVLVKPADDVRRLQPFVDRLALVAVSFPAFNDGRGFSHASRLRGQAGYQGELRAVGDVLIDLVPLMLRCGFDSFAVTNEVALRRLAEGRLPGISNHYQPTARPSQEAGGYSWRRVSPPPA